MGIIAAREKQLRDKAQMKYVWEFSSTPSYAFTLQCLINLSAGIIFLILAHSVYKM